MRGISQLAASLLVASSVASPGTVHGQRVERTTLTRLDATASEGFSALQGARVLSDGRLVVADAIEQTVAIVNLDDGTVELIGRQGSGPGEYNAPGRLFAGRADTTYMLDMMSRRFLVITPEGRILNESVPLRHPDGGMIPIIPKGVDARGRIYFDFAGMMMPGLEEVGRLGRAPLLRWDRATGAIDTLGHVNFPPMAPVGRGEMRISIGGGGPFRPMDEWAVTPDGRVGIARAPEYRVEWVGGPRPLSGPVVDYEPLRVTDAEKNQWADAIAQRGMMVEVENGRRRTRRPPRPNIESVEWPETLPPFVRQSVRATADGTLWVQRETGARSRETIYDVFDASGRLVRQVVVPEGGNIIALGDGVAFVVREDEDGLQWIQRYRL